MTDQPGNYSGPKPFSRLRLEGKRYIGARLPIASMVELERYERLIREVAGALWLADNPHRSKLPAYFKDNFHLVLAGVESGSAVPILEREESHSPYEATYEQAQQSVEEAFAALVTETELPDVFDWMNNHDFLDFGKTLQPGEAIELSPTSIHSVRYTPQIRNQALTRLKSTELYEPLETETALAGRLVALDADRQSYHLRLLNGLSLSGSYDSPEMTENLRRVLGSRAVAPIVRVSGIARVNPEGKPSHILATHDVQLFAADGQWATRLIELANLEEGWCEGAGSRIEFAALDAAHELLRRLRSADKPTSGIFPLADGGVQLEWAQPVTVVNVEIDPDLVFSLFQLTVADNTTRELDTQSLDEAVTFLTQVLA